MSAPLNLFLFFLFVPLLCMIFCLLLSDTLFRPELLKKSRMSLVPSQPCFRFEISTVLICRNNRIHLLKAFTLFSLFSLGIPGFAYKYFSCFGTRSFSPCRRLTVSLISSICGSILFPFLLSLLFSYSISEKSNTADMIVFTHRSPVSSFLSLLSR